MLYIILLFAIASSFILTGFFRRYAIAKSLIDIPNERSSHSIPTPRGGGVAIVLTFLSILLILFFTHSMPGNIFLGLSGSTLLVALIGFLDDHGHVAPKWRLLAHFSAAIWGTYWIGNFSSLTFFGIEINMGAVGAFLTPIYLVWLLNLYNFMDGIDGIASVEAITSLLSLALLSFIILPENVIWPLFLFFAMTVAGFLIWNFPPAKIFMGDACSGFIGIMLGLFSIISYQLDERLLWCWLIMIGVFNVDATVTLIRRIINREKFYEAHRSHAYQHAAKKYNSHLAVTLSVSVINLCWLLPISLCVSFNLLEGLIALTIAYIPLICLALKLGAGKK